MSHLSENHLARALILVQDQNQLCEELSSTTEKYATEVEEYKKNFNDYCSITERLEAEVERRTKELEDLRRNPEAEKLKADVHRLVNDVAATCTRAQEKEDKHQKDGELGVLNANVESQDLALAEMSAKIEIFKDGKQAGGTELLELIKDELPDINFDFLYKEGETAALVLLPEVDNNEAVAERISSEIEPISEVVVEPTNGTFHSQASAETTSSEAVLEPTVRTFPTQSTYTTVFENLQDL
ncbi:hypothetical protein Fot_15420 [Forsythia ovata]|uniref:Uncharacterized protein n=1 Tax=Forsythia ovata TaxID=205694 RepID=A0ABD1W9E1_9LAMI